MQATTEKFPAEFSDLLTPYGRQVLKRQAKPASLRRITHGAPFIILRDVVDERKAASCIAILDEHLFAHLTTESRRIPSESITSMTENYSEVLSKTLHVKTAFLQRRAARSFQAAQRIALLEMMMSETFVGFAEAVTGLSLDRNPNLQVICYGHGDYVGPHNDHHPEVEAIKDGFVDFHVMFTNDAVAHHYLVYEHKGHFSRIVDVCSQGSVSVYRLPFWHYTTPLMGKLGREREARRWLLLGTFKIMS